MRILVASTRVARDIDTISYRQYGHAGAAPVPSMAPIACKSADWVTILPSYDIPPHLVSGSHLKQKSAGRTIPCRLGERSARTTSATRSGMGRPPSSCEGDLAVRRGKKPPQPPAFRR